MKLRICFAMMVLVGLALSSSVEAQSRRGAVDLRGIWVGSAKGSIFGAEGQVTVIRQQGEQIYGIVEGGNFLGKARFDIRGQVRGNMVVGEKAGNTFQGFVYPDGTIRGVVRTTDGDRYSIFLRRSMPYWGGYPYGTW